MLKNLKDERNRLEMIGEQGVEMSVDASFGLSFQRLDACRLRRLFSTCRSFRLTSMPRLRSRFARMKDTRI